MSPSRTLWGKCGGSVSAAGCMLQRGHGYRGRPSLCDALHDFGRSVQEVDQPAREWTSAAATPSVVAQFSSCGVRAKTEGCKRRQRDGPGARVVATVVMSASGSRLAARRLLARHVRVSSCGILRANPCHAGKRGRSLETTGTPGPTQLGVCGGASLPRKGHSRRAAECRPR